MTDVSGRARKNRWRAFAFLAALTALVGALTITSGYGPGLDPDSMAYVGAATSLARGDGLRVPMGKWEAADSTVSLTVWPPAFPVAMALPQTAGLSPIASARMIIALAAAGSAALVVLLLAGAATPLETAVTVAVVLATPSFIGAHLSILSEPLFIASLLLTLYGMSRHRAGVAALGALVAVMTRYAGVSAAAAAALWFLLATKGSIRDRLRPALASSVPAAIAFLAWMVHNSRVAVVQSPIKLSYHPGLTDTVRDGIGTSIGWIAPGARGWVAAAIALAFIGLVAAAVRVNLRVPISPDDRRVGDDAAHSAAILLAVYIAVILASRAFVGGSIVFDARILAPAFLLAEIVLALVFLRALAGRRRWLRGVALALVVVWIGAALRAEGPVVLDSVEDGNDFAASDWRESPTVEWVKVNGAGHSIYTNWPAAIYFNAGRHPFDIPTSAEPDSLKMFGERLAASGGAMVTFDIRNFDYSSTDSIAAGAGLSLFKRFDDGSIWVKNPR